MTKQRDRLRTFAEAMLKTSAGTMFDGAINLCYREATEPKAIIELLDELEAAEENLEMPDDFVSSDYLQTWIDRTQRAEAVIKAVGGLLAESPLKGNVMEFGDGSRTIRAGRIRELLKDYNDTP